MFNSNDDLLYDEVYNNEIVNKVEDILFKNIDLYNLLKNIEHFLKMYSQFSGRRTRRKAYEYRNALKITLHKFLNKFYEKCDSLCLYQIIMYLIYNIDDDIVNYLDDDMKNILKKEYKEIRS